jgi:hypothetical protein
MLAMPPPQFSLGKCGRLRGRGAWTWLLASVTQWKTYVATPRKLQHSDSRHQLGCVGILLIFVLSGGDDKGCMNLGFTLGIDTKRNLPSGVQVGLTERRGSWYNSVLSWSNSDHLIVYQWAFQEPKWYSTSILAILGSWNSHWLYHIYIIFPDKDPGNPGSSSEWLTSPNRAANH